MKLFRTLFILVVLVSVAASGYAQLEGDYRSAINGDFDESSTWEVYSGGAWSVAVETPSQAAPANITIRTAHVVYLQIDFTSTTSTLYVNGSFDPNAYGFEVSAIVFSDEATLADDFGTIVLHNGNSMLPAATLGDVTILEDALLSVKGNMVMEDVALYGKIIQRPNTCVTTGVFNCYANNALVMQSQYASDACSFIPSSIWYDQGITNPLTIERYFAGYDNSLGFTPWHSVAIPMEEALSGAFVDFYLKGFDESTGMFYQIDPTSALDIPLNPTQGYYAMYADPGERTVIFEGKPNNNDEYAIPVDKTNSGFNFVGNPYPSSIDIIQIERSGGINTQIDNIIWVFDSEAGNYICRDLNGDIPPEDALATMQAFFVYAKDSETLTIPKTARIDENFPFLKEESVTPEALKLTVANEQGFDEMWIGFREGATAAYDAEFDGIKLMSDNCSPQLFSYIEDETRASVNVIGAYAHTVFQVGFQKDSCTVSNQYTIEASNIEGFESNQEITLYDKKTEQMVNLRENPQYTFNANITDNSFPKRFEVIFGNTATPEIEQDIDVEMYVSQGNIIISTNSIKSEAYKVYNIMGQLICEGVLVDGTALIPVGDITGIVVVSIDNKINKKLLVY